MYVFVFLVSAQCYYNVTNTFQHIKLHVPYLVLIPSYPLSILNDATLMSTVIHIVDTKYTAIY